MSDYSTSTYSTLTYSPYYFASSTAPRLAYSLAFPKANNLPNILKVVYNSPATIVFWSDGTKTVVKCQGGDTYSTETGLAMAICKKAYGNKNQFNKVFAKWLPHEV